MREKIEEFKSKMPVIRTLGNPGFRDRHWESVSNIVGFPVKGGSNLFQILDMGLDEYVSKFEKISDAATKEFNLEKSMLQAMAMITFVIELYANVMGCVHCRWSKNGQTWSLPSPPTVRLALTPSLPWTASKSYWTITLSKRRP